MKNFDRRIGRRLQSARSHVGYSVGVVMHSLQAANAYGPSIEWVEREHLFEWEAGWFCDLALPVLRKLAAIYCVSIDWVLGSSGRSVGQGEVGMGSVYPYYDVFCKEVGARLRSARKRLGLGKEEASDLVKALDRDGAFTDGLAGGDIDQWEDGDIHVLGIIGLAMVATAYNVSADWLVGRL